MQSAKLVIGLFFILTLCSCASRSIRPLHVLSIDKEGYIRTNNIRLAALQAGSKRSLHAMDAQLRGQTKRSVENDHIHQILDNVSETGATNIMIFIQGGMNREGNAVKRANCLSDLILTNQTRAAYPIFVGWNSDLFSAWWDHDFKIYHGKPSPLLAKCILPFKLVADLARILSRAPISAWEQLELGFNTFRSGQYGRAPARKEHGPNYIARVNKQQTRLKDQNVDLQFHGSKSTCAFHALGLRTMLLAPPKIINTAIVDTGGKIGWAQMLRRTKTLFTTSEGFAPGGLELFARQLTNYLSKHANVSVTIVGHSMGAIVANELIRRHGDRLQLSEIVYMGAACGVEDFDRSVVPYLRRHSNAHFYNLCLHPARDSGETYGTVLGFFAPSGSLLEWIDDYYSETETDYGRVLGKWDNAILGTQGFLTDPSDPLNRQIHLKSFALGKPGVDGPQTHGGFDQFRFWEPPFWLPDATSNDGFSDHWRWQEDTKCCTAD